MYLSTSGMESSAGDLSSNSPEDGDRAGSTSNTSDSPGEVRSKPPPTSKTITHTPGSQKAGTVKKSIVKEITTVMTSVLEQQRRDHERICREMELEHERYKLQMEMEERWWATSSDGE